MTLLSIIECTHTQASDTDPGIYDWLTGSDHKLYLSIRKYPTRLPATTPSGMFLLRDYRSIMFGLCIPAWNVEPGKLDGSSSDIGTEEIAHSLLPFSEIEGLWMLEC